MWLPLKFIVRVVFGTLGAAGLSSRAMQSASESLSSDISTSLHQMATAAASGTVTSINTAWEQEPSTTTDGNRVIDEIGEMVEQAKQHGTNIDDVTPEERARQAELPRNSKKRMWEAEVEEPVRDEL